MVQAPLTGAMAVLVSAHLALAQAASAHATLKGRVTDSLTGAPLAHAAVQLAKQDSRDSLFATYSDSLGHFVFVGIPTGRYLLSFVHPLLDSIGIEPPVREVRIGGDATVTKDLATPSAMSLRQTYCRRTGSAPAAFVGMVRQAHDLAPLAGATVRATWNEFTIGAGQINSSMHHADAITGPSGWFILCGVPVGEIGLSARQQESTSDALLLEEPADGFARRDIYLSVGDSSARGLVQGRVLATDGTPIEGARISRAYGKETRSAADGSWSLAGIPQGTRSLSFRAVRFYPQQRIVDITGSEARSVRVTLEPLGNLLDTMLIARRRISDLAGFNERRRTLGTGRFVTTDDIARGNYQSASIVLRNVPGIIVNDSIRMRSAFDSKLGSGNFVCSPALYVNGLRVPAFDPDRLTTQDIDLLMDSKDILGIEVYYDVVPPQFQKAMSGCGSIVIWMK